MRRKLVQKVVCFALAITTLFGALGISSFADRSDWQTNSGSSASLDEMRELLGLSSYDEYESTIDPSWWNKKVSEISIDVTNFMGDGSLVKDSEDCLKSEEADPEAWEQFGKENFASSVFLPNTNSDGTKAASTTWQVDISEEQTGLYYLQSRYYDPQVGRFLNADIFYSTGQGFVGNNMFAYCLNNPVNGYDPTGAIRVEIGDFLSD